MYGARTRMRSLSWMMPATLKTTMRGPPASQRFAEAARAAVVEVGDDEHLAAAAAEAVHAAALGAGKRGDLGLRQVAGFAAQGMYGLPFAAHSSMTGSAFSQASSEWRSDAAVFSAASRCTSSESRGYWAEAY